MSETNRTTLQVVIEMIASGNGHKVSKDQLGELEKQAADINAKVEKSAGDNLKLGNISNILNALKKPELQAEATAAGAKMGESVTKGLIEEFQAQNYNIKRHWGAMFGQLAGMPGMGMMVATGGTAAAVGISLLVVEKAVHTLKDAMVTLEERLAATQGLMDRMKETKVFSDENLHKLTAVADAMGTAEHSATDWLRAMAEVTRVGADPATWGGTLENLNNLTKLLGGDMPAATKLTTEALQGQFDGLKEVGIVVDSTLTQEQAMTFVTQQLALRINEFGNAAVSAAPKILEIKEAAKKVAGELSSMKEAADDARDAMKRLMDSSEKDKSERTKQIDADEKRDIAAVELAFSEKRIKTRADADAKIQAIQKKAADARLAVDKETFEKQKQGQIDSFVDANEGISQRAGAIADQEKRVAAVDAVESAAGKRVEIEKQLADIEKEASGEGVGDVRARELANRSKELQEQLDEARANEFGARKNLPADAKSRAAEQKRLEDMRKGFAPMDEAAVKQMLEAQEKIKELERSFKSSQSVTTTEGQTKDFETRKKTADNDERQRKELEAEAKNYERRRRDSQKKGLPEPDMPDALRGRRYEYDQHNDRFRWLNQNGATDALHATTDAMKGVAQAAIELKNITQNLQSRLRNDGSRT